MYSNGRTAGISHPSADGQEALIRQAYHNAGLLTRDTTYSSVTARALPSEIHLKFLRSAGSFLRNAKKGRVCLLVLYAPIVFLNHTQLIAFLGENESWSCRGRERNHWYHEDSSFSRERYDSCKCRYTELEP
jgi:hypothetical protein